jgi:antitoxin YefM
MVTTSYSHAREHLAELLDSAADDREVIVIKRRGRVGVALIAEDELRGLEETAHLMRSPANARRLLEALRRSIDNDVRPQSIDELRDAVGLGRELVGPGR